MTQISEFIYVDHILDGIKIPNKLLPNPYYEYPFLIIDDFLDTDSCTTITKNIKLSNDKIEAKIRDAKLNQKLNKATRKTDIYKLIQKDKDTYTKAFLIHKKQIEDFFSHVIIYSTDIQVLGYEEGFFYKSHSDDSSFLVDKAGKLAGFKLVAQNRKITTVCFGNDDFTGGELEFNFLKLKDGSPVIYKPKAGSLLAFPSNSIFTHEVKEVLSRFRVTLVQWHDVI